MKLFYVTLAQLFGTSALLLLSHLPSHAVLIALTLSALLAVWLSRRLSPVEQKILFLASITSLAFVYGTWRAQLALNDRLPAKAEGQYQLIGTVDSLVAVHGQDSQVSMRVQQLTPIDVPPLPLSVRHLRIHGYAMDVPWRSGETWSLRVKLKPPRSTYNPASFDQEAWYLAHGIDAIAYVSHTQHSRRVAAASGWQQWVTRVRDRLSQAIIHSCHDQDGCAQVQALSIGQRDQFSQADWQILQRTGTNHLFAIAGLHIGLVAAACFWLGQYLWRRVPGTGLLWLPAPTAGWIFTLLGAYGYSLLAGFALPTQRACLCLLALVIARVFKRRLPAWHAWSLALSLSLLYQPLLILDASLWLSFGTVALLIYGLAYRWPQSNSHWRSFFHLQFILSLGLWPLTIYYFQNLNVSGLISNAYAIPWVAIGILPLCLSAAVLAFITPGIATWLWQMACLQLHWLKHSLAIIGQLPHSQWPFYFGSVWLLWLASIGVVLLLAPKAVPGRWLGLCYCGAALYWPPPQPEAHALWLSLLDVGQGLSILVRTEHHALVFDSGNRFSAEADMGQRVVVPSLKAADLHHLDALIISHGDMDHAGGAASIATYLPIDHFYTSDIPKLSRLVAGAPWQSCVRGLHWTWDSVDFQFLYPPADSALPHGNDRCCVLKITVGQSSVLLTGDIEKISEYYLVSHDSTHLASSVLVAPHHGSKTSSTEAFVSSVQATIVLFPYGYHNRYHFPHPSVMQRYRNHQAQLYDSASAGQINVYVSDTLPLRLDATRQSQLTFWRYP